MTKLTELFATPPDFNKTTAYIETSTAPENAPRKLNLRNSVHLQKIDIPEQGGLVELSQNILKKIMEFMRFLTT